MATKLNAEMAKRVSALGIKAKDEEEARKQLLKIITKEGIDGMEDEDTMTLIEIAESVVEPSETSEDIDDADPDAESEELADEAEEEKEEPEEEEEEKPVKKTAKKKAVKEEEPEPEEDEEDESDEEDSGDEFDSMDRTELKAYIKENSLDIHVKKSMSDDDIREAIRDSIKSNEDESEEEEPEEEEKPVKKVVKKEAKKETKKVEKVAVKKEVTKKVSKRGIKLLPKTVEADREAFEFWEDIFPKEKYEYAWVVSHGVTIKHKGKNSSQGIILLENCATLPDGKVKANMYLLTMAKKTEVLDEAAIEYGVCWNGSPYIKGITFDEAKDIVKELFDEMMSSVTKIDAKLGVNRKKMEESLKKTKTVAAEKKVPVSKKEEKEPIKKTKKVLKKTKK